MRRDPSGKSGQKSSAPCLRPVHRLPNRPAKRDSQTGPTPSSAPIGRAYAEPQVFDLTIVSFGAVLRDTETKTPRREPSDRLDHGIRRDNPVALRGDEVYAGVEQFLLRVQHVERGALPHPCLLAHAR